MKHQLQKHYSGLDSRIPVRVSAELKADFEAHCRQLAVAEDRVVDVSKRIRELMARELGSTSE